MIPRRRGVIDVSRLEDCVRSYLEIYPGIVERRQHYTLLKVLDFLKEDLRVKSYGGLLRADAKRIALGLQRYIAKRVGEGRSAKSIRFEIYLARSFFSFHDIEIPSKSLRFRRRLAGLGSIGFRAWPRFRSWLWAPSQRGSDWQLWSWPYAA